MDDSLDDVILCGFVLLNVNALSKTGRTQFILPNILAGCLAELPDGSTLLLMFVPACSLAGAVAVVGKLALGAAVQFGLTAETAVAHLSGQAERETNKTWKHYS